MVYSEPHFVEALGPNTHHISPNLVLSSGRVPITGRPHTFNAIFRFFPALLGSQAAPFCHSECAILVDILNEKHFQLKLRKWSLFDPSLTHIHDECMLCDLLGPVCTEFLYYIYINICIYMINILYIYINVLYKYIFIKIILIIYIYVINIISMSKKEISTQLNMSWQLKFTRA